MFFSSFINNFAVPFFYYSLNPGFHDRISKLEFFWDPHHKLIKFVDLFPIAFSLFFSCFLVYLMNFHSWFTLQPYTLNKTSMSLLIIRNLSLPIFMGSLRDFSKRSFNCVYEGLLWTILATIKVLISVQPYWIFFLL